MALICLYICDSYQTVEFKHKPLFSVYPEHEEANMPFTIQFSKCIRKPRNKEDRQYKIRCFTITDH